MIRRGEDGWADVGQEHESSRILTDEIAKTAPPEIDLRQ